MFIDDRGRCRRGHTEHLLERRVSEVEAEVASLEETSAASGIQEADRGNRLPSGRGGVAVF
jgi:hypothetical protein